MIHTDAKVSLHGYKAWRRSLIPLEVGTTIQWVEGYTGLSLASNVKAGQTFRITNVRESLIGKPECDADKVYDMVLVSKSGRPYKKKLSWSVESIARGLHEGKLMLQLKG